LRWPRACPTSSGIPNRTTRCELWPRATSCAGRTSCAAETERLLNDLKAQRFIEAFTDYWLDLRKVDDTSPSTTLYNDYELDDPLKLFALEETRLFVAELRRSASPTASRLSTS
jgi:hypothetical protein